MTEQMTIDFGRETSREAIREFADSGERKLQQDKALAYLQQWPYSTASEVGEALGISAHKRLPELAAMGKIERVLWDGKPTRRICRVTGRPVMIWRPVSAPQG